MKKLLIFNNGITVDQEKICKITDEVLAIIKKELPEEAQCVEITDTILEEVKSKVHCKKILL